MRLVFTYHDIAPEPSSPWCVAPDVFRDHITALIKTGFELVSVNDILAEPATSERRICAITFDDGRLGAFHYGAPILEEYGARGTFYICPSFLDQSNIPAEEQYSSFMTWEDARALIARGHCVGSHGMRHARLTHLSAEEIHRELGESKTRIEHETNNPCTHFAAPFGDLSPQVSEIARALGYESVASITTRERLPVITGSDLPRYQVHQGEDFKELLYATGVREGPCVHVGEYIVRQSTDSDDPKIHQLLNQVLDTHRSLGEYRWRFKETPWTTELPLTAVVCERGDTLVGVYPRISTQWQCNEKPVWALHTLNPCILDEHRESGVLQALTSLLCPPVSSPIQFELSFRSNRALLGEPHALRYQSLGNFTALRAGIDDVIVEGADENSQIKCIDRFDDEHDRWWRSHGAALFPTIIPRTSRYLNWRFADHPFKRFRLIQVVGPNAILGYAVVGFAIENGKVSATVYDFLCAKDPGVVKCLIRACAEAARKHQAHSLQCWMFQHTPYYQHFEASGFAPDKEADIHFVISAWDNTDFENRCIASAHDWYVTIGDSGL
jgi:peptidoglycan/xylan/chitin deacetylase (PgdA/CDA1 family)